MKKLTIKSKMTIWFSLLVIIIAVFSACAVLFFSNSVIQSTMKSNLIQAVEGNINEIEFHENKNELKLDDEYDIFLTYGDGVIEIDDDFIREINGVTTSIYDNDSVLYGESIIDTDDFPFLEKGIRSVKANGVKYYVYDKMLKGENTNTLWIRGIVSSELGLSQTFSIINETFLVLPLLVLIAIIGAFLLTKKSLEPIDKVNQTAQEIRKGQDLTKRIEIGSGDDEVHRLAGSFNSMFERLEDSFNKEQQFNSDISHELRTPISVILSECEYTLEEKRDEKDYIEALELIQRQSKKMSSMINNMLDYSRLEKGKENTDFEKINLSQITQSVCDDMALIKENNITLSSDIDFDIFINGNAELITRLITNLISNSYKYGKTNGNIYVSLKENENEIKLKVRDDGIGISDKDIDKIFNTFYRADASRNQKGFGLGLSFVRKIAELHGGSVKVNSIEGNGSEFIFEIKSSF